MPPHTAAAAAATPQAILTEVSPAVAASAPRGRGRGGEGRGRGRIIAKDASAPAARAEAEDARTGAITTPKGRGRGRGGAAQVISAQPEDGRAAASSASRGRGRGSEPARAEPARGRGRGGAAVRPKPPQAAVGASADTSGRRTTKVDRKVSHQQAELAEQAMSLAKALEKGSYECIVCILSIGKRSRVWNCPTCFTVLHASCAQKWYKQCASLSTGDEPKVGRCPSCRAEISSLPQGKCFCGKESEVEFDPYATPHSCNQPCGRTRPGCPHPCALVCHPGPCAPCAADAPPQSCPCGATTHVLRCSSHETVPTCSNACNKQRDCSHHTCDDVCHHGPCRPCDVEYDALCFSHDTEQHLPCAQVQLVATQPRFSCRQVCGRTLACGVHTCSKECHPGECGACPLSPSQLTRCACGKTSVDKLPPRAVCTDPIPTCTRPCNKVKRCGHHKCTKPCHVGECGGCDQTRTVQCRCGQTSVDVSCVSPPQEVTCQHRCDALRCCQRHRCDRVCCPDLGTSHGCPLVCGRRLRCGQHDCMQACHAGPCPPCLNATMTDVFCGCGATSLTPPVPCGVICPPCAGTCPRVPNCGHTMPHRCHPLDQSCPPCVKLVPKLCACRSKTLAVLCSQVTVTCGRLCDEMMPCGLHRCPRRCHDDPCAGVDSVCRLTCRRPLPCGHACAAPCHLDTPCPTTCDAEMERRCVCGHRSVGYPCSSDAVPDCNDLCLEAQRKEAQRAKRAIKRNHMWAPDWLWANDYLDDIKSMTPRP